MATTDPTYRYATVSYQTDGVQTDWQFNFAGGYISQADVKAYSGVINAQGVLEDRVDHPLTFLSDDPSASTVRIIPPVADDRTLTIYRDTVKTESLVNFSDGSIITEQNLDLGNKQATFNAAEFTDRIGEATQLAQTALDLSALASGADLTVLVTKDALGGNGQGFLQTGTGARLRPYQARLQDTVSVLDFIPANELPAIKAGTSTYDCSNDFDAAVAAGLCVHIPAGTYNLSRTWVVKRNGAQLIGDGQNSSILLAKTGFTGANLIELGSRTAATLTETASAEGFTCDMNGQDIAFSWWGIRDGSTIRKIRVRNSLGTHFRSGLAGSAAGVAGGMQSQGVLLDSLHAITTSMDVTGDIFDLNGMFECTLLQCKALGASTRNNVATGFRLGKTSECRGVSSSGNSVGNLKNAGGTGSFGYVYDQWAQECWDDKTTFESIHGSAVRFHGGAASGTTKPLLCRSTSPRLYNSGAADANVLSPAYRFGSCAYCYAGTIAGYMSNKVWARFEVATGQANNIVDIQAGVDPATVSGTIILFDAGSGQSNLVTGWASQNTTRRAIRSTPLGTVIDCFANGVSTQYNSADVSVVLDPTANKFIIKDSVGSQIAAMRSDRVELNTLTTLMGSAWNGPHMQMGSWHFWVDSTGRLRIKGSAPTSDVDGSVVGTQT